MPAQRLNTLAVEEAPHTHQRSIVRTREALYLGHSVTVLISSSPQPPARCNNLICCARTRSTTPGQTVSLSPPSPSTWTPVGSCRCSLCQTAKYWPGPLPLLRPRTTGLSTTSALSFPSWWHNPGRMAERGSVTFSGAGEGVLWCSPAWRPGLRGARCLVLVGKARQRGVVDPGGGAAGVEC